MKFCLVALVVALLATELFAQNPFVAIRAGDAAIDVGNGRVLVRAPGVNLDVTRGRGVFVQAPGFDFSFNRFATVPVYQAQVLPAQVPQRFAAVQVLAPGVAVNVGRPRLARPVFGRRRCR